MKNAPDNSNFPVGQRVEIADFTAAWQKKLQECVTHVDELFSLLDLPESLKPGALRATALFPLKTPRRYVDLIEKANPHDPLLRQILPLGEEANLIEGYSDDPLQELANMPQPGFIQKYHGRALLTLTGACAVNCRYCFRRAFPYHDANPANKLWPSTLEQIASDTSLGEIILSGGDPLLLSDARLQRIVSDIENLAHIHTLRLHSRVPVVLPERLTTEFFRLITNTRLNVVLVIHCNHPREIDAFTAEKLRALKKMGITLLNQSVLLRGVNDTSETLIALSKRLFDVGVLPYYLHMLDKVSGAAHFDVAEEKAHALHQAMLSALPGYLTPKLVREIPGETSKTPLGLSRLATP